MQAMGLASGRYELTDGDEVNRRIQELLRLKRLCGWLAPARERRVCNLLETARAAAVSPTMPARVSALRALDVLGLELCDD